MFVGDASRDGRVSWHSLVEDITCLCELCACALSVGGIFSHRKNVDTGAKKTKHTNILKKQVITSTSDCQLTLRKGQKCSKIRQNTSLLVGFFKHNEEKSRSWGFLSKRVLTFITNTF